MGEQTRRNLLFVRRKDPPKQQFIKDGEGHVDLLKESARVNELRPRKSFHVVCSQIYQVVLVRLNELLDNVTS